MRREENKKILNLFDVSISCDIFEPVRNDDDHLYFCKSINEQQ
jgi:hypothetical protein